MEIAPSEAAPPNPIRTPNFSQDMLINPGAYADNLRVYLRSFIRNSSDSPRVMEINQPLYTETDLDKQLNFLANTKATVISA